MEIEDGKVYVTAGGYIVGPMCPHGDDTLIADIKTKDGSVYHSGIPFIIATGLCQPTKTSSDSPYHIVSKYYGDDEETRDLDGWKLNDFRRAVERAYYSV